jgi:hypothetical protein
VTTPHLPFCFSFFIVFLDLEGVEERVNRMNEQLLLTVDQCPCQLTTHRSRSSSRHFQQLVACFSVNPSRENQAEIVALAQANAAEGSSGCAGRRWQWFVLPNTYRTKALEPLQPDVGTAEPGT